MAEPTKLSFKLFIEGEIEAVSGLHIGGFDAGLGTAGGDLTVVRNPMKNPPEPFIPGSSLKGKMRYLLECARGEFGDPFSKTRGVAGPATSATALSAKLFGVSLDHQSESRPGSRLVIHDAPLSAKSKESLSGISGDRPYTEVKREAALDRVTAAVTPREVERVIPGAIFEFKAVLTVYKDDPAKDLVSGTATALRLLQDDYLGGHGSRGYGQVALRIRNLLVKDSEHYIGNEPAVSLADYSPEFFTFFNGLAVK